MWQQFKIDRKGEVGTSEDISPRLRASHGHTKRKSGITFSIKWFINCPTKQRRLLPLPESGRRVVEGGESWLAVWLHVHLNVTKSFASVARSLTAAIWTNRAVHSCTSCLAPKRRCHFYVYSCETYQLCDTSLTSAVAVVVVVVLEYTPQDIPSNELTRTVTFF